VSAIFVIAPSYHPFRWISAAEVVSFNPEGRMVPVRRVGSAVGGGRPMRKVTLVVQVALVFNLALTAAAWTVARSIRWGVGEVAKTFIDSSTRIALERERRATLVAAMDRLPPGGTIVEFSAQGHAWVVRTPGEAWRGQR
jgi:multisubunit Na+/H+ antiporter MnhE subunit